MKLHILAILFASTILSSCSHLLVPKGAEKEQAALFSYLAERRNMKVLKTGGQNLGDFDTVYSVLEPRSAYLIGRSKEIAIAAFDSFDQALPVKIREQTPYHIEARDASRLAVKIAATLPGRGVDVDLLASKLVNSQIRFTISRVSAYERQVIAAGRRLELSENDIPRRSSALVLPIEILIVSDFSYSTERDTSVEGKVVAKLVKGLSAEIGGSRSLVVSSNLSFEGGKIVAIRPHVLAP